MNETIARHERFEHARQVPESIVGAAGRPLVVTRRRSAYLDQLTGVEIP